MPAQVWFFDAKQWTLTSPDGRRVSLSSAEYGLLTVLAATPGQPVERAALFQALGRDASGPDDRSIDLLISRLRRKFESSDFALPVKSVRGIGYVFPEPVIMIERPCVPERK